MTFLDDALAAYSADLDARVRDIIASHLPPAPTLVDAAGDTVHVITTLGGNPPR